MPKTPSIARCLALLAFPLLTLPQLVLAQPDRGGAGSTLEVGIRASVTDIDIDALEAEFDITLYRLVPSPTSPTGT